MADGATAPADARKAALAALAEAGAHLVLCGDDKRPKAKAWQKRAAALLAAQRHKGPVGVVPASIGCAVIDVDRGGERAADEVVELLGTPLARVPTRRESGFHLWYRCREAGDIGNSAWRDGEVRAGKGYAILWDAPATAAGLAGTAPTTDLMAVDLARLPPKPNGGAPGNRNDTLNRNVFLATVNGEPAEPHTAAAREAGLPEREIAATVASATKGAERDLDENFIPRAWTPGGLAECLERLGVGLRFNIRARRFEYCIGDLWAPANDRFDARLRHAIEHRFKGKRGSTVQRLKYSPETYIDLRNALGNTRERDPFRDWLETLPAWDEVPRIDGLLTTMFGADDDALTRWASRYIGIGAVQRAFEPGCKLDEVPVLLGAQGVGKSAFVLAWIPDDQPEWHGDAVDLSARQKEQAEQMAGSVVCELSELAGIRKAKLEQLKSFMTRRDDGQFRWAYARAAERSPRRCVFVGSTNESDCLPNDPSGNRRFVVAELRHGCHVEERAAAERVQWWAEALHRYRAGGRANLPRDLLPLAADRAEEHRDRDSAEEDIRNALHDLEAEFTINDLHDALRAADAQQWGRPLDKAMQMRLGTALRNLGFRRTQRSRDGTRLWVWSCHDLPPPPIPCAI